jgi:hypothetical protein
MRLFAFGTLMDPDLLALVLDRPLSDLTRTPASLPGYRSVRVLNESYPTLSEDPHGVVRGQVLQPMDGTAMDRLIFYEAGEYALSPIMVDTAEGPVDATLFASAERMQATAEPWTFESWALSEKTVTLALAEAFMKLYGTCTIAEADQEWPLIKQEVMARLERKAAAA